MAISGKAAPPLGPGAVWTPAYETTGGYDWQAVLAQLSDGSGNKVNIESADSEYALKVVPGHIQTPLVHLDAQAIAATQGFMLVDLSDTTNWPHTATGHIHVHTMTIDANPDTSFIGTLIIGFLASVDGDNGDFHHIASLQFGRNDAPVFASIPFGGSGRYVSCQAADVFGDTTADDTTWQTDVNLYGPDGTTAYPAGAGDLVAKVVMSAGNIDFAIQMAYDTVA